MRIGTRVRARTRLEQADPTLLQKIPAILKSLGLKTTSSQNPALARNTSIAKPNVPAKSAMPTYYGQLIDFAWHNTAVKGGAHFTPIYSLIEGLQKKYPNDSIRLRTMQRRLVYLEVLRTELEDIEGTYDIRAIALLPDWLTNKVETFAMLSAELALVIVQYYVEKTSGRRQTLRFEELVDALPQNSWIFSAINTTLEAFLVVSLRNEMVHSTGFMIQVVGGNARLRVSFEHGALKFGLMQSYLKADVLSKKCSSVVGKRTVGSKTCFLYQDWRFPFLTFSFPRSKKGTASITGATLQYDLSVQELTRMEQNFLFYLAQELFGLC
jgi:hypothetical protein